MFERLFYLFSLLGHWGYLIIFLAAFLESSAFMGLLVPGETIVILAGYLAYRGYLELGDSILVIILGAVLGDTIGYSLGKVIGRGYFERHRRLVFLKERHIKRTEKYFREHGGKTIFFGRFIGFLRAMAPFVAGMSGMSYRKFFTYNVVGGVLWSLIFTLLGYFLGESWQLIEKWAGRVGVFVFFMLLIVVGFSYLYKKVAVREVEFYQWFSERYRSISRNPHLVRLIERHPVVVSFLKERLSPGGYLGLHLTLGLVICGVFVWIFASITEDILTGDPLVMVDRWVLDHLLYLRAGIVTRFMIIVTHLGGVITIMVGSLLVSAYLLLTGRANFFVTYLTSIFGGWVLVFLLKVAIRRPRPVHELSLIGAWGWSFPSSHAMMSVIFYGMIAYIIILGTHSWRVRVATVTITSFLVFTIGLSRIYLQVHYLSDVLAGYVGGLFWLTVCITGLEVYKKKAELPLRHV